jgi:RNA polymerase sigma factor for flagellar operon FliA
LQQEARERLAQLIPTLPADSAALIRSIYFEGLTLQEAGERLGISKGWASRLHARALEQLARGLRSVGIDSEV